MIQPACIAKRAAATISRDRSDEDTRASSKTAHREISQQRSTIGQLLGRIRDLEHDLPEDGVHRVLAENTALKQQTRQLTQDNQRLTERLRSARENNRFLDKRIADLEGHLISDPSR